MKYTAGIQQVPLCDPAEFSKYKQGVGYMTNKERIKDLSQRLGMNVCGIASIDRFSEAPKDRHPSGVLPGCRSVIVIGVRLLDGAVQANFRAFEDGRWDLKGIYGTYGYSTLPNFLLTYSCYAIAQFIEQETDACAMPLSTGPLTNGIQISLRHSAVAAGLGELGWSGLMLVPEFGPRIRFGAILTTLELEADPLYEGPPLCNPEKCGICTECCPTKALSAYEEGNPKIVEPGGKHLEYCRIDRPKCQMALYAMNKKLGGKEDYLTKNDPETGDILETMERMPLTHTGLQHFSSFNCGRCLSYCPVGNWGKRFRKTGLSKGPGNIKEC